MFCHFNSSRAIVLLQLGRTEKGKPSRAAGAWTMFHKFFTQIRDQPRAVPGARGIHTGCFERRQSSWVHANVNAANGVPWKRHLLVSWSWHRPALWQGQLTNKWRFQGTPLAALT